MEETRERAEQREEETQSSQTREEEKAQADSRKQEEVTPHLSDPLLWNRWTMS